ncbi:MAG: hypothetical protein QOE88_120 [Verrucomicrobiota bacterium]|jgi:hypothetical protein|nr:hypothetical protein [Verrucomicrobiota bacterium]
MTSGGARGERDVGLPGSLRIAFPKIRSNVPMYERE